MQIHIIMDLTGENLETQLEMARRASKLAKEVEKEFDDSKENAPERVEVTPKALEEHLIREKRQREYDRRAIALFQEALGII